MPFISLIPAKSIVVYYIEDIKKYVLVDDGDYVDKRNNSSLFKKKFKYWNSSRHEEIHMHPSIEN